jgi:predicted transporter
LADLDRTRGCVGQRGARRRTAPRAAQFFDLGGALVYALLGAVTLVFLGIYRVVFKKWPSREVENRIEGAVVIVFLIAVVIAGVILSR